MKRLCRLALERSSVKRQALTEGNKLSEQDSNWKPIGKLAEELARKLAEKREAEK